MSTAFVYINRNDTASLVGRLPRSVQEILPASFACMQTNGLIASTKNVANGRTKHRDFFTDHQSITGIRQAPYHVPSMIISIMPNVDCAS